LLVQNLVLVQRNQVEI
jgi:hypothetical protein